MNIAGLQKLTLLDFPDRTAATVFTPGCNLRCPFCHNAELVKDEGQNAEHIPPEEFFAFLDKRVGLLDGVCITGGEPLLQADIADFCSEVRARGFAVKLDTNGFFPDKLRSLVEAGLVDYVAIDIKNSVERYAETVGVPHLDLAPLKESISFLLAGVVPYEFRTTVVREFHDRDSLLALAQWIKDTQSWYLQSFVDSDQVLIGSKTLHAYSSEEMEAFLPELGSVIPTVKLRGI